MSDLSPKALRRHILHMAYRSGAIHIPSALSIVNIVSTLKGGAMIPGDRLILSKGHGVLALYAAALETGELTEQESLTYLKDGSRLFGLSDAHAPGCDVSSGSLGHGLSIATGLALGLKRRKSNARVFCIAGDGELQAGPNWEAIQFAAHHKLDNLVLIVDNNGFQALGQTGEVIWPWARESCLSQFGWLAIRSGPGVSAIRIVLGELMKTDTRFPRALVVDTIKGHGVSFMEDDNSWHYRPMDEAEYLTAIGEQE